MSGESYTIGDAGQLFDYEYQDNAGSPTTLTGQAVTLVFRAPDGTLKTRTMTLIAHPDTGDADKRARYALLASDFAAGESGIWYREFHATGAAFTDATKPIAFYVSERLSAT